MVKVIDKFLDNITMYRLVLYYLIVLSSVALLFGAIGILPFSPVSIIVSIFILISVGWSVNTLFAAVFKAQTNIESVYITALILALIITPLRSSSDLIFLGWVAVWSSAGKYIIAINKKHIFNPAAFAITLTALTLSKSASWWIGTSSMFPFVLLGGLIIVRKIRRSDLVLSFFSASLLAIFLYGLFKGTNLITTMEKVFLETPLVFFATVMLTEPLTTPPTKKLQIYYGALVGLLFSPQVHIGSFYTTPELALIGGNIFSYIVSPKQKLLLKLKEKIEIAPNIYDFIFTPDKKFSFTPGQYMEWTLGHNRPDSRGNRRYFTLASSPSEENVRIGIKFYPNSSSYKKSLIQMGKDNEIVASQLAGDFVLPNHSQKKFVFMAGGIGITPFRSIIRYLTDSNQAKSIVLFYANKTASEIVYKDVLDSAREKIGIKTVYTLTDPTNIPSGWKGKIGRIDEKMIKEEVPDFRDRLFYLSGPYAMVTAYKELLKSMNVPDKNVITDYFPGYA